MILKLTAGESALCSEVDEEAVAGKTFSIDVGKRLSESLKHLIYIVAGEMEKFAANGKRTPM